MGEARADPLDQDDRPQHLGVLLGEHAGQGEGRHGTGNGACNGPSGIPSRAVSILASATSSGKKSGLTGEILSVSTSEGGPMTAAMRAIRRTSSAVWTPGPWTGLTVQAMVWRYMAGAISGSGTSWG